MRACDSGFACVGWCVYMCKPALVRQVSLESIRIHVDTKPQEAVAAIDLARLWRDVQPALQLTIPEYRRPAIEEVGTHRAAASAQLHAPI